MDLAKQRALIDVLLGFVPAEARKPKPKCSDLRLHAAPVARGRRAGNGEPQMLSYRHLNERKNNQKAGLANEITDSDACVDCSSEFPLFVGRVGQIQSNSGMCRQ